MNVPTSTTNYPNTWQGIVNAITAEAKAAGLSTDQANAAITVAKTEGGYGGIYGDNGTSFGPFQFHYGGQLDNFAAWLGLPILVSGKINPEVIAAANNLDLATQFALSKGGYLYNSLVNGSKAGNSGLNLALYLEHFGQGAGVDINAAGNYFFGPKSIANVTASWVALFGKSGSPPVDTVIGGTPAPGVVPDVAPAVDTLKKSTDPVFGGLIDAINGSVSGFGASLASIVVSIERFFWIAIGLLIFTIGLWLLVKSDPATDNLTPKVVPIPV